jgi:ankyrin repeat protein
MIESARVACFRPDARHRAARLVRTGNLGHKTRVTAKLALHEAAQAGDLARAETLLNENPYLASATDDVKQTALHHAAAVGHADVTELLLTHAAAPDAVSHVGRTPLHQAAEAGHLAAAQALLDHKARPGILDSNGQTPLHLAARQGHVDLVRLLLTRGADPNAMGEFTGSPLHEAAANGRIAAAQALLEHGALANAHSKGAASAWTPWHEARKAGRGDLAELLRQHGGEDRARGPIDIHRAAERGYIGRVRTLLAAEPALLDSRDFLRRRTALHWAAERGDLPIAGLLLSRGADRALADKEGRTPLDLAEAQGHAEMAALLSRA